MRNSIEATSKTLIKFFLISFSVFIFNVCSIHAQWIQQNLPPGQGIILSVDFLNTQKGISGGWCYESSNNISGKSFYTSDGGAHWLLSAIPDSVRAITNIKYISDNIAYAVGAYNMSNAAGRISVPENFPRSENISRTAMGVTDNISYSAVFLKTTNGGASWLTFGNVPGDYNYLYQLEYINPVNFLMIGTQQSNFNFTGKLGSSTDGGNNWNNVNIPLNNGDLNCLQYVDGKIFAAGYEETSTFGDRGIILRSDDNGKTWTKRFYLADNNFNDMKFTDITTGYACSYFYTNSQIPNSRIYRTTDGGSSWNPISINLDSVMLHKIGVCKNTGVVSVFGSKYGYDNVGMGYSKCVILRSSDYGNNWVSQNSIINGNVFLREMVFLEPYNAYLAGCFSNSGSPAGGTDPQIYHTTNGGYDNIYNQLSLVPDDFQLFQNYPNPFNPVTQIKFKLNRDEFISLKIFSSSGKEISTLLNARLDAGSHTVMFDGAGAPSGIYFYTLKGGDYSQTLKMILLK